MELRDFNLSPEAKLAGSINELYEGKLSDDEATEAAENLRQFFELLIEIDKRNDERDSNEKNRPTNQTRGKLGCIGNFPST